jgi:hypothetical protein
MTTTRAPQTPTQSFCFENSRSRGVVVRLEPWANELSVAPGEKIEVTASSTREPGRFEIEVSDAAINVHAWSGATLVVEKDGHVVLRCDLPVPPIPKARPS